MHSNISKHWHVAALICGISLLIMSCQTFIGPYDAIAYQNATSLKVQTLSVMTKATEPYSEHKTSVESLMLELSKAHEYAMGLPDNEISTRQWEIISNPEGAIIGKFFTRWRDSGTLGKTVVGHASELAGKAFDKMICLELNKKEATDCD